MKHVLDEEGTVIARGRDFDKLARKLRDYYAEADAVVSVIAPSGRRVVCEDAEHLAERLASYWPGRDTIAVAQHVDYHFVA